jgi:hypothetical protein
MLSYTTVTFTADSIAASLMLATSRNTSTCALS